MRLIYILFLASLALKSLPTQAQNLEKEITALNNVQHEFTVCTAYYSIVKKCMEQGRRSDDIGFLKKLDEVQKKLIELQFETGKTIGMTDDAMRSRLALELEDMTSLIQNNCINISSLLNRYAKRCKAVFENPDAILQEYME